MESSSQHSAPVSGVQQLPLVSRLLDKFYLLCACLSAFSLVALCSLVLWSVLSRIVGQFSSGTTDYAGYFMAASTFLAFAYTFRSHGHIRVELFFKKYQGRALPLFCFAAMAATTTYLAYYLIVLCYDAWEYQERSEGADAILLWIPQSVIAFGALVFAIAVWQSLLEYLLLEPADENHPTISDSNGENI